MIPLFIKNLIAAFFCQIQTSQTLPTSEADRLLTATWVSTDALRRLPLAPTSRQKELDAGISPPNPDDTQMSRFQIYESFTFPSDSSSSLDSFAQTHPTAVALKPQDSLSAQKAEEASRLPRLAVPDARAAFHFHSLPTTDQSLHSLLPGAEASQSSSHQSSSHGTLGTTNPKVRDLPSMPASLLHFSKEDRENMFSSKSAAGYSVSGDADEDEEMTTPQAIRTAILPLTRRPMTRSQTTRLAGMAAAARILNQPAHTEVDESPWTVESQDSPHRTTGGLRLPLSTFTFRANPDVNGTGDIDIEFGDVKSDSGSDLLKRKRTVVFTEGQEKRPFKVRLGAEFSFTKAHHISELKKDKTFRPSHWVKKGAYHGQIIRRSMRNQHLQPATSFDRVYHLLPDELKVLLWKTAATETFNWRCVVLHNKSSAHFQHGRWAPLPPLFHTSVESRKAIMKHYKLMFGRKIIETQVDGLNPGLISATSFESRYRPDPNVDSKIFEVPLKEEVPLLDFSSHQYVNPDTDVIVYQPCGGYCRAYHCARKHFKDEDRYAVRFLALRTDTDALPPFTRACWQTMSLAWPNVEILYLITNNANVCWSRKVEWALIRVDETLNEDALRNRFDLWKQLAGIYGGKEKKVSQLVFVKMVPKLQRQEGQQQGEQYSTDTRKVLPADVIIG